MRTRHKRLTDYGIPAGEAEKLYDLCRSLDNRERGLLHAVTVASCPVGIVESIFQSLINGDSWEKLDKKSYIPIGKSDFYGYRRKTLAAFYWKLERGESNGRLGERRTQQNT